MQVRRAEVEDATTIAAVHVRTWQVGYHGLLPQPLLDSLRPEQRVPRWTATVRDASWPTRGTLVAEERGELVGFADLRPDRDEDGDPAGIGHVASFYVLPSVWGRGTGRALMAAATETFGAAGFTSATLWSLDTNTRAIGFYAHLGWELDGAVRPDVCGGARIQDVRMRRELS